MILLTHHNKNIKAEIITSEGMSTKLQNIRSQPSFYVNVLPKAPTICVWEVLLILLNLLQHLWFSLGPCQISSHSFFKSLLWLSTLKFSVKAKCPKLIKTYAVYWQIPNTGFSSLLSLAENSSWMKSYCFSRTPCTSHRISCLIWRTPVSWVCCVSVCFAAPGPWLYLHFIAHFCISDGSGRGEFSSYFIKPICSYRSWLRNLAGRLEMGTF